jgi:hypothetical protein
MLLRVSGQLEDAFPPGIETRGEVEDVLRLIARMILGLHKSAEYLGFLRMMVADSRQFPWIAEEFAAVMEPKRSGSYVYRPSDCNRHSGLPQSDAGGSPVHGDAQRAITVALDDGSRKRARSGKGDNRRGDPDVPAALPAPAIEKARSRQPSTTRRA